MVNVKNSNLVLTLKCHICHGILLNRFQTRNYLRGSQTQDFILCTHYAVPKNRDNVLLNSTHGIEFAAAIKKDNLVGVQFHPEKSHKFGATFIKNFLKKIMRYRIIPTLLLKNEGFVKSKNFKAYKHLGDPENIVRIFNELEVDELSILDISVYRNHRGINFNLISKIAAECFMPLSYGGGINNICQADQLFEIGLEKIILNSVTYDNPSLVQEISYKYGTKLYSLCGCKD